MSYAHWVALGTSFMAGWLAIMGAEFILAGFSGAAFLSVLYLIQYPTRHH